VYSDGMVVYLVPRTTLL